MMLIDCFGSKKRLAAKLFKFDMPQSDIILS